MKVCFKASVVVSALLLSLFSQTTWGALIGVTATDLVIFNPSNPSNVTVIGPHNISPADVGRIDTLTYHPQTRTLFAIGDNPGQGDNFLLTFDPMTGNGTVVANLG